MKSILKAFGGVVAVALATGVVAAAGIAQAESNGGVRVFPLGDSITHGTQVPGGYRIGLWQRVVNGGFRVDFVGSQFNGPANLGDHDHEGHPGWRIDQIDANIVGWMQTFTPRTVLLHIGTNDVLQNFNLSTAPNRLSTLIDRITNAAPNADVFVAQIIPLANPNQDAAARTFNAAIPGIVQSKVNAGRRVHLVDMHSALTTADLIDGVHPTAGGYDKMAARWYAALQSVPGSIGTPGSTTTTAPPTSTRPPATTTRPPTTTSRPPTTTTQPPTTQSGGRTCTATYRLVNSWPGGFQGEVTVRNTGTTSITGWTTTLGLATGQTIVNLWDGVNTGTTGTVPVRNASYNGTIAPSGSRTFGYVANGNGATAPTLACAAT
jgi:lysophospholipase L1-like esterase